jgi:hypothetical protein
MLDTGLPNTPSHDPSLHPNTQSAKLPVKLKPHHNYGKIFYSAFNLSYARYWIAKHS